LSPFFKGGFDLTPLWKILEKRGRGDFGRKGGELYSEVLDRTLATIALHL
jgi:hypothetical protein